MRGNGWAWDIPSLPGASDLARFRDCSMLPFSKGGVAATEICVAQKSPKRIPAASRAPVQLIDPVLLTSRGVAGSGIGKKLCSPV